MSDGITPLSPTRLERVRALFDAALEAPTAERRAFVAAKSAGDAELRAEVDSLLAALERADDERWERPAANVLAAALREHDEEVVVGTRIGPYEITRLIGMGGMGAVYEGSRADDQFHKRVALKFLRRGVEGDLAIRRFRYERQILASLSHKNIAALLDGGVTPDGQPYIVMEYVDGSPITTWARERRLSIEGRLQLLRQVCAAVAHAHQSLVVHRDLKPGNILVTPDGTVKLLDFGIARLLREGEGPDQLPPTQGGAHAFTPDYASPEQVRGLPVATASDLYSLGVVASELLAGERPFRFEGKLFAEMQAMICEAPPPPPSSLVTPAFAATCAEGEVARVRRRLGGDVDAIVLQTLRKEPARRYRSAEQLSDDLRRVLEGLPVSARRDTIGYRFGKFVRRRRVETAAGVLVVASLVGGIVATTRQAGRAERERQKAEQVNAFLSNMLAAADPGNAGRNVTVVQVLQQAARDVEKEKLDPETEAQIRHTIAQTYYGLGLYEEATPHAERAYRLRRQVFGDLNASTLTSLSYVAAMAEARGDYAVAESVSRRDVTLQKRMKPIDPTEVATALDNLARAIELQGRLDEAMKLKFESLTYRRMRSDSAARAAIPYTLNNLSVSYTYLGDFAKAESLAREALVTEASVASRRSFNYGSLLRNLASVLDEQKRSAEADSVVRESIAVLRDAAGPRHTEYIRSVNMYATLRYSSNDMREAVRAAREVVQTIGKEMHESEPTASASLQVLGLASDSLGDHAAADTALRRSLELRKRYFPPDHWAIASSESVLGYHYGVVGRFAEAEAMMSAAYEKLVKARGRDAQVTRRVAVRLAELMTRQGRLADAARWRAKGEPAPT